MQGPPPAGMGRPGAPPFMRGPQGSPAARTMAAVIDRLEAHGVKYFKTTNEITLKVDRFRIGSTSVAANEYQGTHKLRTLTGAWEATEQNLPAGSLVITLEQPLARLVFMLLDPMSDDGFMTWNILDPLLGTTPAPEFYPVLRTMEAVAR